MRGPEAFETRIPFDEIEVLGHIKDSIQAELGLREIQIRTAEEVCEEDKANIRAAALPGQPQVFFYAKEQ